MLPVNNSEKESHLGQERGNQVLEESKGRQNDSEEDKEEVISSLDRSKESKKPRKGTWGNYQPAPPRMQDTFQNVDNHSVFNMIGASKAILLVDDQNYNLIVLEHLIKNIPYIKENNIQLLKAEDGLHALTIFKTTFFSPSL